MLNEPLVRAVVPRYLMAHGDTTAANRAVAEEIESGFVWTGELVDLLHEYEQNRAAYRTMNDFMPRIIALLRARVED